MTDSDVVIRVEGLGKKYALQHEKGESYTTLRDVVARQAKAAGRLLNPFTLAGQLRKAQREAAAERAESEEEFWALKDVSFEIRRGERVGIIGRNGAGKSTLLKILSRITEPTTGRVEIRGRVASLLEVGTGFHPELTGRENIYLNGAILGMTRREIRSKFDEIVDFAEVEKFLDTPVKRYSSGMYVRLAFAVAAYLDPEILMVDEVLAVGDASFQKKCLAKMEDVADREGRTIMFISHNILALKALCNIGVLFQSGLLKTWGDIGETIAAYESSNSKLAEKYSRCWLSEGSCPGDELMRLVSMSIEQDGKQGAFCDTRTIKLYTHVECGERAPEKSVGLVISDSLGRVAIHTDSLASRGAVKSLRMGLNRLVFTLPAGILKPETYTIRLLGLEPAICFHFDIMDALVFRVVSDSHAFVRYHASEWLATSSPFICEVSFLDQGEACESL